MSSTYTGLAAGGLKRITYNNFRGVDFSGGEVADTRSPDALNMWKNYRHLGKLIETRPGTSQEIELSGAIYGLFFYEVNNVPHLIIHAGVKLYDYNLNTKVNTQIKSSGMKPARSVGFIMNNILFIKDGLNYYEYNGTTLSEVVGTIPNIAIHNMISGQTKMIQEPNLLTDWVTEQYIPDGEKTDFYLSQKGIDNGLEVWDISNVTPVQITTGFTIDVVNGIVTFNTAPALSTSASLEFKYKKTSDGRNSADKCKLACVFDNRIFMGGSEVNPNMLIWSGLNDARYIGNTSYSTQGNDESMIKALVPGNNALWVFKEPSHNNTTIFYNVPYEVYDGKLEQTIKTYASSHSSITKGCKYSGINFNDDIVFLSDTGLEGISSDITTEQVLAHRSTLVDSKLLQENYEPLLTEWEGYLLICIDNKVYLADSHQRVQNNDHIEYEWFYWEIGDSIDNSGAIESAIAIGNDLYLGCRNGKILKMNYDTIEEIESYWCTKQDDLGYPQLLKTTNKKGFITDLVGEEITISTRLDNKEYEELATLENTKGYVVTKIKKKKWKTLQLKFSSETPFGIYETTYEAYIGSYVKRS